MPSLIKCEAGFSFAAVTLIVLSVTSLAVLSGHLVQGQSRRLVHTSHVHQKKLKALSKIRNNLANSIVCPEILKNGVFKSSLKVRQDYWQSVLNEKLTSIDWLKDQKTTKVTCVNSQDGLPLDINYIVLTLMFKFNDAQNTAVSIPVYTVESADGKLMSCSSVKCLLKASQGDPFVAQAFSYDLEEKDGAVVSAGP